MNTKAAEYFRQLYRYEEIIASNTEQIEKLRLQAQKITASISGSRVQSSGNNHPMAEALDSIMDLQHELEADIARLYALKKEAQGVIAKLENPNYRLVLTKRYFEGKSNREIAFDMNCSYDYVRKLIGLALNQVEIPE